MMNQSLDVYLFQKKIGELWLSKERIFNFQYTSDWAIDPNATPLSLTLPLQKESFEGEVVRAFFANLLPEARIRELITRQLGISEKNDFGLLRAIGGECGGAVSLIASGKTEITHKYQLLTNEEFIELLKNVQYKPLLASEEGLRLSLAGAQDKLPVYLKDKQIFIPRGDSPSSHIIKIDIPGFSATVENEAFCMRLAKSLGLNVPNVNVWYEPASLYITERYDRSKDQKNNLVRLHQEDFCQALGVQPEYKYEAEGGPSLERCFQLLRECSISSAADQIMLLQWVIFNYLIGNTDAHAKNLSLLYSENGLQLAPFYDLLSTAVYPNLTDKFAMKIGGENRIDWIAQRHWERFAESVQLDKEFVLNYLRTLAENIFPKATALAEEMHIERAEGKKIIAQIIELIKKQATRILSYKK